MGPTKSQTIDAWLATATRGLCDDAKERITEEVTAHYVDTLRAEIAKGEDAYEAVLVAERSLGNARAAHRQFRWRHLTKHESMLAGCFTGDTARFGTFHLKSNDFSMQNLMSIFMLTLSLFYTPLTSIQATFIAALVPLYLLSTNAMWNPPQRLTLFEKFQWRACIAFAQAPRHAAALIFLGNLAAFGETEDPNPLIQLFSTFGYRLVFGGLVVFRLWDSKLNLRIARKVRGYGHMPEPT